jgi:tetratricopeptide (TPR) repeat protein
MLILLSILTTYIWTSNRINAFYYHYNNAKEAINKSFESNRIDEKISLLKYAIYETENAKKIKNSPDLEIIENLAKNKLNAWEEVLKIKNQINKLNLASFQEKLRNLESILSDDKLFQEIYAQILKARLLSEYISSAKTLKEQGKVEEAKKLIEIVQSKIETTTINLETKIEEQPQLKVPKTKEPTISSDIKIDIPEIGKVDITIQKQEKTLEGVSLNYALKLKELYEDKGDLEGTIKLAMDILKEDPKNTSAEFYLQIAKKEVQAIQLEKEGRYKEALNLWSEILKLDQNNIRAKKAIIRLGSKI